MKLGLLALMLFVASCTSTSSKTTDSTVSYTDPFAYCEAVGQADKPSDPYTGPKLPREIVAGLKNISMLPLNMEMPSDDYCQWRCMDTVLACCAGVNVNCTAKADINQNPTPEMSDFCNNNPNAKTIPASSAGRSTVYSWSCSGNTAVAGKQLDMVDTRGYVAKSWHVVPVLQEGVER